MNSLYDILITLASFFTPLTGGVETKATCTHQEAVLRIELVQAVSEGNYSLYQIELGNGQGMFYPVTSPSLKLYDIICLDDVYDYELINLGGR